MVEIKQAPRSEDEIAREAGIAMYGTSVGSLRRRELWQLGNAWGAEFPAGCTKDYMIVFFKQLEAEGKNPFNPPHSIPEQPTHSGESHVEVEQKTPANFVEEKMQDTEALKDRLMGLKMNEVRQIAKSKGVAQTVKDKKKDLVEKILGIYNNEDLLLRQMDDEDTSGRG